MTLAEKLRGKLSKNKADAEADPWLAAARATQPVDAQPVDEWVDTPTSWKTRAMRVAVIGACAIVGVAGLRSIFLPRATAPQQVTDVSATFPVSEAQGIAARFASSYLALTTPTARKTALGLDSANDTTLDGWNGSGAMDVESIHPSGVKIDRDGRRAVVTVLAQVTAKPSTPTKGQPKPVAGKPVPAKPTQPAPVNRWVALAVPVAVDGGRVSVAGMPAFVGLPTPKPITVRELGNSDGVVAQQSRAGIEAFFRAYGGADAAALEQTAAPGAHVAPLGGGCELIDVMSWAVSADERDADGGRERSARATVRWRMAGAELTQSYDVGLAKVSSGSTTSWRVKSITAAH